MLGSYTARLLVTGAGALVRGHVGLLDEVRTPMLVWPSDVDVYAHLNNGRFFTLMDVGRWELAIRTGLVAAAQRHGWRPVVVACAARFRRELKPLARFALASAIRTWDDKYFYVEHRFEKDGQAHAVGFVQAVSKREGQTVSPAEMFQGVGFEGPAPEPQAELAAWIASLPRTARRA